MPYTHTTYAQLKTQLANRLGDATKIFWTDTELGIYLTESLRTFGLCSGFWRARGIVTLQPTISFYDLQSTLSGSLLTPTVTDRDLIQSIQYSLLESTSTQTSWPGTSQFTYNDIVNAIQLRRNQFLADTGVILTHNTQVANTDDRQTLSDNVIELRRLAWLGLSPFAYYTSMWRSDEVEFTANDSFWNIEPGTPRVYSVMLPPPLQIALTPPPSTNGILDIISVNTGPSLNPVVSATVLGIPNDLCPGIKWGVMADLFGIDGQARDLSRANFCEKRYQQYVQLGTLLSSVLLAELNGQSLIPESLHGFDASFADWQNDLGQPRYIAMDGWNLASVYPVPDKVYSATFDVVRNTPVPTADTDQIQIGREQLDGIIDYAEHIAMLKVGGAEFTATARQADNFLIQCVNYNQRLSAQSSYIFTSKSMASRESMLVPYASQSDGLGAMPSIQQNQSFVTGNAPARLRNAR